MNPIPQARPFCQGRAFRRGRWRSWSRLDVVLLVGALLTLLAGLVFAAPVNLRLAWDANPAEDQVTAYHVEHASNILGPWDRIGSTPGTLFDLGPVEPGNHFYRVIAANLWGESEPSSVVFTPPALPRGINTLQITRTP